VQGGQLRHAESLVLAGGGELELYDRALKYLVGSGRFARNVSGGNRRVFDRVAAELVFVAESLADVAGV